MFFLRVKQSYKPLVTEKKDSIFSVKRKFFYNIRLRRIIFPTHLMCCKSFFFLSFLENVKAEKTRKPYCILNDSVLCTYIYREIYNCFTKEKLIRSFSTKNVFVFSRLINIGKLCYYCRTVIHFPVTVLKLPFFKRDS